MFSSVRERLKVLGDLRHPDTLIEIRPVSVGYPVAPAGKVALPGQNNPTTMARFIDTLHAALPIGVPDTSACTPMPCVRRKGSLERQCRRIKASRFRPSADRCNSVAVGCTPPWFVTNVIALFGHDPLPIVTIQRHELSVSNPYSAR